MLFLVLIVIAGLLAAAVWWLQRNQARSLRESVERSRELPPLPTIDLPDFSQQPTRSALQGSSQGPVAAQSEATPPVPPPSVVTPLVVPASLSSHPIPTPTTAESEALFTLTPAQAEPGDSQSQLWQDQVKRLKDKGELELALVLCQQQFPKSQAFQQAAIVLRLQMKQELEQGQDIEPLLVRLYRCAVLSDLFRSNAPLKPANPRHALKSLAAHEFQYPRIGHRQLKLLSKSDIKLLENRWGHPPQHLHGEAALGSVWENICR